MTNFREQRKPDDCDAKRTLAALDARAAGMGANVHVAACALACNANNRIML